MRRYALYFTPPPGALARFGAAWLGWDADTGTEPPPPEVADLPRPRADLTEGPRKYGLHATLKPPFRLVAGTDETALREALERFAAKTPPATAQALSPRRLGGFLALLPDGDSARIDALAASVVAAFDAFRSPPGEADLARYRTARLSDRQEALLQRWGYPHVMEAFRFHITLTGRLPASEADTTLAALAPHLAPLLPAPFVIDALSLCGEHEDGRFRVLARVPLRG